MKTNDKLPDSACVGYYWMSDAADPVVIGDGEGNQPEKLLMQLKELLEDKNANPFVIEAQLFYPNENLSVGIRYVDGNYIISRKNVAKEDLLEGRSDRVSVKRYVANRMPGKCLLFLQYWREKEDILCERMNVLQPSEMAFIGFETIKTNKGK